jgi:hypothetical protein
MRAIRQERLGPPEVLQLAAARAHEIGEAGEIGGGKLVLDVAA